MEKVIIFLFTFLLFFVFSATVFAAGVYVQGYYRSDGIYVPPHFQEQPPACDQGVEALSKGIQDLGKAFDKINQQQGQRALMGTINEYASRNEQVPPSAVLPIISKYNLDTMEVLKQVEAINAMIASQR